MISDANMDARAAVIQKARAKYISSGVTRNITEALRLYLEHDAGPDEQIPLFITTPELHQIREILKIERPLCDECDAELAMKINAADPEGKVWPTAWICKGCAKEFYSYLTAKEWLKELQDERKRQTKPGTHEPIG